MTANRDLVADLRARLTAEADPQRAASQQQYMKSELPYYGVTLPRTAAIAKELFRAHPIGSYEGWRDTVLTLFREAERRELWYVAEELAEWRAYREYARRMESLEIYDVLITEGAWWDIVDGVAAHLVGGLFEMDAAWTASCMREWSRDEHLWKRRTSIICQLRRRSDVDLALLYDCIEANVDDHDFFIRKAIGWALREVAKTQPHEVIRYVETHRDRLSPLSKRKALKNVLKSGLIVDVP